MLTVDIDNKAGTAWNISEIVASCRLKTSRYGKPGTAELTLVGSYLYGDQAFRINPGDVVRIRSGSVNLFYGYVFVVDLSEADELKVLAYDQIRYLAAAETYSFVNKTATDVIRHIVSETGLQAGALADTRYAIPKMLEDGQKMLDTICKALEHTLTAERQMFIFYDDYGELRLQNIQQMILDVVLGERSLLYGYKYKRSIDSDTYNRIKLVRDNKDSGKRDVYIEYDSATIARWGQLQLHRKVEDGANEAQILEALRNLLERHNREKLTFQLNALGDPRVRAGSGIYIELPKHELEPSLYLVNECTHNFEGGEHTMQLDMVVFDYVNR